MGFWIFMLICCLLCPAIMIIFGRIWIKKPPKNINDLYGYRTRRSSKNKDTWDFAHKYCGKLWYFSGWVLLAVSLAVMIFVFDRGIGVIGWTSTGVLFVQCIVMVCTIIPVEAALKRNFDENGYRK